jgi:hypothetical protein
MQQRELNLEGEARFIDLDEILDPYERMKGDYYIVKIIKAEYCDHRELKHVEFIALELVVVESIGNLKEKNKYKFKGKKLFLNISLDSKKIWLLKNLCNALNLSGRYNLKELAVILTGKMVKARVASRYDKEFDEYYHIINRFKTSNY